MVKDAITLHAEKVCDNCSRFHTWSDLKKCNIDGDFGLKCLGCNDNMITNLIVTVGYRQNLPIRTYIQENQSFLTVRGLRLHINELYDSRLENNEVETFDLMLFRDLSKQLFWNSIFHMIDSDLPYDFILPYEGLGLIRQYQNENLHVPIYAIEHADGFQIHQRSRRHKSEIPLF